MNTIFSIVYIVVTLIDLALGIIILVRNPKNKINQTFFAFILSVIFWTISIYLIYYLAFSSGEHLTIIGRVNFFTGAYAIYFLFLFTYFFPKPNFPLSKTLFKIILAETFLLSIISLFTPLIDKLEYLNGITLITSYGPLYFWFIIHFATFMAGSILNLFLKIKSLTKREGHQMKFVYLGVLLATVFVASTNLFIPLLTGYYDIQMIGPLGMILMTVPISYAIVKHRLMDIKLIIIRSLAYLVLLLVLGLMYSSMILLIGSVLDLNATSNFTVSVILSLVIALSFQPIKQLLEQITDKIFFKNRYSPSDLLYILSQTITTTLTLSTLTYSIIDLLSKQMKIKGVHLAIINDNKVYIANNIHQKESFKLDLKEFELLKNEDKLIIFDELDEGPAKEMLRKKNFSIVLPLQTKSNFLGFLILSDKENGEIYFNDDLNVIEILGPQLAIALENARRFEEINQFNQTLQEEIKKATNELRIANQKLKKLDDLKDEFISIASHDLRNPLATIKNYIWLAKKEIGQKGTEEVNFNLDIASESASHAISLVNDMLDTSRIEAGRIELKPERININNELDLAVTELKKLADDKKIQIQLDTNSDIFVLVDSERCHQVITNLIGNAIKFTPNKGIVKIHSTIIKKCAEISISDNGIGIKDEDIHKLFTKFGKLDSGSNIPKTTGTGLGLYISKNIIELSGGRISVKSKLGTGSTFTFTLPLA